MLAFLTKPKMTQGALARTRFSENGKAMKRILTRSTAPPLFEELVDRAQTEMPDWYLRSADGVLIAGKDILRAAGHRPGTPHLTGWSCGASGFKKTARDGKTILWVQQCGKFWIIERSLRLDGDYMKDETLVFAFGSRPIWTRTREVAMRLAELCDPIPAAAMSGYWTDVGNVRVVYRRNGAVPVCA
jgi:hypothetical protein